MRRAASELGTAFIATAIMAALIVFWGAAAVHPPDRDGERPAGWEGPCLEAPLSPVSDSGIEGVARLCVDRERVGPALQLRGLRQDEAYSAWLAYFERPSACFHTPCALIDLRGDDPPGVFGRIDAAIAPGAGVLELRTELRDLDARAGSQVSLFVLYHGGGTEAGGQARARKLLTPQMVELGAPLAGPLGDGSRSLLQAQAVFVVK